MSRQSTARIGIFFGAMFALAGVVLAQGPGGQPSSPEKGMATFLAKVATGRPSVAAILQKKICLVIFFRELGGNGVQDVLALKGKLPRDQSAGFVFIGRGPAPNGLRMLENSVWVLDPSMAYWELTNSPRCCNHVYFFFDQRLSWNGALYDSIKAIDSFFYQRSFQKKNKIDMHQYEKIAFLDVDNKVQSMNEVVSKKHTIVYCDSACRGCLRGKLDSIKDMINRNPDLALCLVGKLTGTELSNFQTVNDLLVPVYAYSTVATMVDLCRILDLPKDDLIAVRHNKDNLPLEASCFEDRPRFNDIITPQRKTP